MNSSLASSLHHSYNPHLAFISFYLPSGSYNYNSIKICKQISTPPQPYQKMPDIYLLRSCSLPNFITIPSPIIIQFVVDVFVLYVILYLLLYCLLCYLVLRPQSWINSTTTVRTSRLAPTTYSECSRFHPNPLTFGGVIPECVNTAKTGRKLFPIFGWS